MLQNTLLFGLGTCLLKGKSEALNKYKVIEYNLTNFLDRKYYNTILDIGCGDGKYGSILKEYCNELIGIDININTSISNNLMYYYDKLIEVNILEYPEILKELNYNLCVMTSFIEHIQKEDGLNIIKNMSNSDIFISTPSKFSNSHTIFNINNKPDLHKSLWNINDFYNLNFTNVYNVKVGILHNIFYGNYVIALKNINMELYT